MFVHCGVCEIKLFCVLPFTNVSILHVPTNVCLAVLPRIHVHVSPSLFGLKL